MVSAGQELKRERELRGISLKEISTSTKISLKFLKALEDDQPELLPGRFFIKGILRSYAKAIGLDEDYVLNKYDQDLLLKDETRGPAHKTGTGRFRFKSKFVLPLIVALVVLGLIIFSIIYLTRSQKAARPVEKRKVAVSVPAQTVIPPPPPVEKAKPEPKDLALELAFTQDTWIQVYADGALVLDGIKMTGEKANLRATREFVFNLGNAGGLTYTLNGQEGKPMGAPGEVVREVRVTLQDFRNFIVPEARNQAPPAEKRG
jgi:cytoskeletal protein RodZ